MRMLLLLMMMVTGAQLKVAPSRVKRQSYGGMGGGGSNYGGGNSYGGQRAYGGGPSQGRANVDVSEAVVSHLCIMSLSGLVSIFNILHY